MKNKTLEAVLKCSLTLIPRVIDPSLRIVAHRNPFAEGLHLVTSGCPWDNLPMQEEQINEYPIPVQEEEGSDFHVIAERLHWLPKTWVQLAHEAI